jgi:branched-chain amino acid transport system ATP-binding protein
LSNPESAPGPEQLRVTDLKVTYGDFVAVERASFSVRAGECVAIIGPNGNGKSSIALAIAGLVARTGKVELDGVVAPPRNPSWMAARGLSLVPERRQLFAGLPVADNILLGCYSWTKNLRKARASDAYSEAVDLFPELQPRLKQLAGTLSGGQQQMVALARGLAARPKILVIDEPCLGLAEIVARRMYEAFKRLNDGGRTIILVEENPLRALEITKRALRVERGILDERVDGQLAEHLAAEVASLEGNPS